ncbi:hypothetical protein GCM10007940_09490 [Portibacter lacus]|uniref:DUF6089 domain-containing protein n=1 Tax=Portibacter lacus TaxID=1099794 RepID=A0AA37WE52_9BACT|nr:hypothetical protein GCM10007940_09490 [Portibacter lacus]
MSAQTSYFEAGGGIGLSNYNGDMSSDNVGVILGTSRASAVGFIRYNLNPYLNFKLGLTYASLGADDATSQSEGIKNRNLSFYTNLYEIALTGEINIFKYEPLDDGSLFTLYAMGGIGGFYFNPIAELDGQKYELQKLGTEGQGLAEYPDRDFYSLYQLAVPFGGGLKFKINESFNFNTELSWRLTFTDYIDDLSTTYPDYNVLLENRGEVAAQLSHRAMEETIGELNGRRRGNPDIRDYYFTLHIGISYNLVDFGSSNNYRSRNRKSNTSKCPKF